MRYLIVDDIVTEVAVAKISIALFDAKKENGLLKFVQQESVRYIQDFFQMIWIY